MKFFISSLLLLFCSCIDFKSYQALDFKDKTVIPGSFVFIPIKHVQQKQNYCVIASTCMLLNYQNIQISQSDTSKLFENDPNAGLFIKETIKAAKLIGINWKYHSYGLLDKENNFNSCLETLKLELNNGKPVLIGLTIANTYHAVILAGYDETSLFVVDPQIKTEYPFKGARIISYSYFKQIFYGGKIREWVTLKNL